MGAKIARLGDNIRQVAVTEGDKVEALRRLGFSVNGHGVGDLAAKVNAASEADVDALCAEYNTRYAVVSEMAPGSARREFLWTRLALSGHPRLS